MVQRRRTVGIHGIHRESRRQKEVHGGEPEKDRAEQGTGRRVRVQNRSLPARV